MSLDTIMSPPRTNSKFTRGEKCIFVHLLTTFVIILVMIITYFSHLCLVKHDGNEFFRIYRRSFENQESLKPKHSGTYSLGVLYTNVTKKIVCHTLLLRHKWSLAPAHCIAIRSDPDMAYLLNTWTIKYIYNENEVMETSIKRNIIHAQFNRDDFDNNIGLLEHTKPILLRELVSNQFINNDKALRQYVGHTEIVGWDSLGTRHGESLIKKFYTSSVMIKDKCNNIISPIIDQLRDYELCVTIIHDYNETFLYHGAVLVSESEVIGFFSWGDKRNRGIPFIILNIDHYKNWWENIMKI